MSRSADLATGEWAVVRVPSDEETDFETFTSLAVCQGTIDGHYRRFKLGNLPRDAQGAPVVNMDGVVVGLAGRGQAMTKCFFEAINWFPVMGCDSRVVSLVFGS